MNWVEQELRVQRKQLWIQRIKESKFVTIFVLATIITLSWNIYRSNDKIIESERLVGIIAGIHQVQGNLGSSTTMLSIKLNNGENVIVIAPNDFIVRNHAEVEINRSKTEQGSVHYYFSRYM